MSGILSAVRSLNNRTVRTKFTCAPNQGVYQTWLGKVSAVDYRGYIVVTYLGGTYSRGRYVYIG